MTKNELLQAFKYRLDGLSYEEISEKTGHTRQSIRLALQNVLEKNNTTARYRSNWFKNQPKLTKIILEEYGNLTAFCKETGCSYRSTQYLLQGVSYPRPETMKKLLKVTGLKYSDIMRDFEREEE